ncbi:HD-GYP domain-containing protein (c-di-GMP phosphodiesterase class II) [Alteromonadaceae bacterium 2753L.S.0a.02]|nr:HD-GYP domain-containing protein (c-di-GMP phosphodiesterase class II) [Alteromonadaceae bacterium 2753L.S.0a.02]
MSDEFENLIGVHSRFDKKINVRDLHVGMYVTKLDRDWLETPFLIQGLEVESAKDIEELAQYCEHVWVHNTEMPFAKEGALLDNKPSRRRTAKLFAVATPVEEEHAIARKLTVDTYKFISSLFDDIRLGRSVEEKKVRKIVRKNAESVIRNPDALSWMTRMRDEDRYTAEHSMHVCILALVFGRALGLPEEQLNNLGLCGLLHDVGKIRIPDEILNKPGKLSDKEMAVMKAHSAHGRKLLAASPNMYEGAIDVAFCHHERPDGKGYPQGLQDSEISLFSKMIAIVDAYDAMTCDRVYAKARPTTEALRILYECRGTQFDEKLVLAFIQTIGLYPPGSVVELRNGCVGLVVATNDRSRHLPKVLIMRDEEQQACKNRTVDLSLTLTGELSTHYHIKSVHSDGYCGIYLRECFEKGLLLHL